MSGTLESYARELCSGETLKREMEEGLGPLMAASFGEAPSSLGRLRGWPALGREERESRKGRWCWWLFVSSGDGGIGF